MRKTTTALLAPLAALAITGTVGASAAQAHDPGHHHDGHHGHFGPFGHPAPTAEVATSEEASTALSDAGVTLDAVDPATAEPQEDGTTVLSFPVASPDEPDEDAPTVQRGGHGPHTPPAEIPFDGGVSFTGGAGAATEWDDPTVSTSDGVVSVDIDGEQVDVLQATPADDEGDTGDTGDAGATPAPTARTLNGPEGEDEGIDLVLTADGADALNEVTGDDSFAEGDVFASAPVEDQGDGADEGADASAPALN